MIVYAFRIIENGKKWWVIHDGTRCYSGPAGGTRKRAMLGWTAKHGQFDKIVTYRGLHRRSEAAMTISGIKMGDV